LRATVLDLFIVILLVVAFKKILLNEGRRNAVLTIQKKEEKYDLIKKLQK